MKLIGFIKQHNNLEEAKEFSVIKESTLNNRDLINNTIDYLNNGVLLIAWMGYFMDLEDGSLIAPDSYYTDGHYVWPAYFPYYLKKHPKYYINKDFLSYLLKRNFLNNNKIIDPRIKDKLERQLSEKLNEPRSI